MLLILVASFIITLILGIPVAFALGISALISFFYAGIPVTILFQRMFSGINSFVLLAIPLFILMGAIMEKGVSTRIVSLAEVFVGFMKGGLAAVNVLGSMIFAGISGSAVADTVAIGAIVVPMMDKEGYDRGFTAAITATSGTIGLIIPPSNTIILYSFVAGGVSIAELFAAGIIPGILVGIAQILVVYIISVKRNYPCHKMVSLKELFQRLGDSLISLSVIIIVIGGIIFGVFTATEAAAIGVVYSFIICFFIYKELKLSDLIPILLNTVYTTAVVVFLIATSSAFSYLLAYESIPEKIGLFFMYFKSPYMILFMINILLLFVGMFIDMSPAIIIFTPIFLPIVRNIGMDPVQFGIIMMVNLCVGLCTPPVGSVLFATAGICKIGIREMIKPLLPFLLSMVVVLFIVTYWEDAAMFLPNIIFNK